MIQLPIINAHEFTPHPKLQVLAAFDTLLVKEDGSLYDNNGRRTSRTATVTSSTESTEGPKDGNRYQVLSKNGTILYVVSEGGLNASFYVPIITQDLNYQFIIS